MRKLDSFGSVSLSRMLLICIVMLLVGGGFGYSVGNSPEMLPIEQEPVATPPVQDVASMGPETVSPAATLLCSYAFSCGHSVERQEDAREVIGKTEAEVEALFPDAQLTAFSPDLVSLKYARAVCCPSHYVLLWQGGVLAVYGTDVQTLEYGRILTLDAGGLGEEERAALAGGLRFDSLEEINLYLEGLDE